MRNSPDIIYDEAWERQDGRTAPNALLADIPAVKHEGGYHRMRREISWRWMEPSWRVLPLIFAGLSRPTW